MQTVKLEFDPPAALIVLNRPEVRNAISETMIHEIHQALSEVSTRDEISGVIVTGAGETFSAGADLSQMKAAKSGSPAEHSEDSKKFMGFLSVIYNFPKPVVAAVNGPAIGGGCGLASVCDVVLASEKAVFGYTEVRIGFVPALASVFLSRICGDKKARELLLTGRMFSASEAREMGLVNRVVGSQELISAAKEIIHLVARNSPLAVSQTKQLLAEIQGLSLSEALSLAAQRNALSRYSEDFSEGVEAFFAKRSPHWKGR